MTPSQSQLLRATLYRFVPLSLARSSDNRNPRQNDDFEPGSLGPMHHLVHFPMRALERLLPDGTDSRSSPGAPYRRKMWGGGHVALLQDIPLDGQAFHCSEKVEHVYARGKGEDEKIYVRVKREIFAGRYPGEVRSLDDPWRRQAYIAENRRLVFMREHNPDQDAIKPPLQVVMPKNKPHFFHKMTPTRDLLFRFSALTFNAHAIHLDRAYCREVEGHRNLLVQGNLMVVLATEVLQSHLRFRARGGKLAGSLKGPSNDPEKIISLEYKNLRPLYVDEEMRICVRRMDNPANSPGITYWEFWIEGADGGFSFRGQAKVSNGSSPSFPASRSILHDLRNDDQESGPFEETVPDEEMIPDEDVAFQKEVNARDETDSSEGAPDR